MKSYHPNFIRTMPRPKSQEETKVDQLKRSSAPCFSMSDEPPMSPSSSKNRYSLWDPTTPWESYKVPATSQTTKKIKRKGLKRYKLFIPYIKAKRKKRERKALTRNPGSSWRFSFDKSLGRHSADGSTPSKRRKLHRTIHFKRIFRTKYRGGKPAPYKSRHRDKRKRKMKIIRYKKMQRYFKSRSNRVKKIGLKERIVMRVPKVTILTRPFIAAKNRLIRLFGSCFRK